MTGAPIIPSLEPIDMLGYRMEWGMISDGKVKSKEDHRLSVCFFLRRPHRVASTKIKVEATSVSMVMILDCSFSTTPLSNPIAGRRPPAWRHLASADVCLLQ